MTRRRPAHRGRPALAAVAALAVLGAGCAGPPTPAGGTGTGAGAASSLGAHLFHPPVGDPPNLDGALLTGGHASLAQWRGSVLVVNFWQSACAPCAAEAPLLDRTADADRGKGVRFLGVDVTDTVAAGRRYERIYRQPYPSIEDPQGTLLARFARYIDPTGTPDTLVFNPAGALAGSVIGSVDAAQLGELIAAAGSGSARP